MISLLFQESESFSNLALAEAIGEIQRRLGGFRWSPTGHRGGECFGCHCHHRRTRKQTCWSPWSQQGEREFFHMQRDIFSKRLSRKGPFSSLGTTKYLSRFCIAFSWDNPKNSLIYRSIITVTSGAENRNDVVLFPFLNKGFYLRC